jgi:dTDP-4-amino-4,6-dideoxy-D-galactose acyltransferase
MIQYLDWDSNFFGCKIGKLTISENDQKWPSFNQFKSFDLVYIFSPIPLEIEAPLVDIKVIFRKNTSKNKVDSKLEEFQSSLHSYQELLELVYLSGHDSRFLKDPFFGVPAFQRLYKKWIDNAIADKDTKVLVYVEQKRIAGFVTYTLKNESVSIGLIAVSKEFQGKGIGKKLIDSVENDADEGIELFVPTQKTNAGACNFYNKLGFEVQNTQYIYHYESNSF